MSDWEDEDCVVGAGVGHPRNFSSAEVSANNNAGADNGWKEDDGWQEESVSDTKVEKQFSSSDYNEDRGSFQRGRGRGRGRGGRGGRNDYGSRSYGNNEDGDNEDGDNHNGNSGFRGRGRGGRGGGRGGGRRFDNGDNNGYENRDEKEDGEGEDGEPQKPRELYIPPEPSENETDIFGSGISTGINFSKYEKIDVKLSGENIPPPIKSFEEAGLREILITNIKNSKYTIPTPIQKHTLPIVMAKRDVMGCAQTGSGKTASFLIPIIHMILQEPDLVVEGDHVEPQCIIVTPTRELTIQIFNEARKFSHSSVLKICMAYGGTGVRHQADKVMSGCHILVATPGRLMDFLGRGRIQLASIRFIVLDEADRMLDMGFLPEMEKLMSHSSITPKENRQTLMFSATFPEDVQTIAAKFLTNYLFIAVGIVGGACSDVDQMFYEVEKFKKKEKLKEILREENNFKGVIVFVETQRNADFIAALLSEQGIPTTSIHGARLQREREEALRDFKLGTHGILVATGVASRGLDIKNVRHVVNYDLPKSIDEYVHRIGRTGRVGNKGKATSFYDSSQDSQLAGDLVKILTDAGQPIPDFLQGSAGNAGYHSDDKAYGGRDMRGDNYGSQSAAIEEEEEAW